MASPETGTTPSATADQQQPKPPSWEYQLREYLLLLSSVVAIATYSAGLAPPGGVRQEDHDVAGGGGQYKAGDPILQDIAAAGSAAHARYLAFYYCNATAFAASLVVNLLLLVLKEASTVGLATLRTVMVLDVLALMAAYAAGSCRDLLSTVFVSTLVVGLSAYLAIKIIYQTRRNSSATTTTAPAGDDDDNELRKVLMLLATFATEITYTAGLSPPGGFQDDGDPTLRSAGQSKRLMAFFYCNTAAFVASLSIVVPLLSSRLQRMYLELYPPILVALLGLMGAYTAGSSRDLRTIAYVVALVAAVLAYILLVMAIALKKKHDVDLPGGEKDSETASPRNEKMGQLEGEKGSKNNELMKDNDFVLLLATLAASITYQAGLDPPGGVWSMDDELYGHKAGDPILLSTHAKRYKAFFYCNSTAFAASLVVILMVQSSKIVKGKALVIATMILDLFGLIGAYAAGSCRDVSTSIYVIALAGAVLVYVVIHVVFWPDNCYVSNQKDKVLEKRRERLLLLAILVATIAYQAGLTPPGGFWDKDDAESGHRAGVPVLLDNYPRRYHAFFYCNATAFMASVALIILLVNPKLYNLGIRCYALYVCMMVGLFGLMGAYAAGSARRVQTSIYVFVLVGVVIAFLLVQLVYFNIRAVWKQLLVFLNIKKEPATSNSDSAIIIRGSSSGSEQHTASNTEEESKKKEYLMTLAILAASVTYQAGLNPPGSVWQDGRNMGNPVMRDSNHHRYNAFFYCNSTSFMASIIVIILLLQQYQKKHIYAGFLLYAMNMVIVVDLLGLLGAYAAGSCRDWETSGYVIALAVVVLASIMIHFTLWYYNGRSKGRVVEVEEISTLPVNHS